MKTVKIAAACVAMILCVSMNASAQMQSAPPKIAVEKVTSRRPEIKRKYNGLFDPIQTLTALARVSGTLEKINFKEGDLVRKGDVLFEIENVRYKANVQAAQASIESIQAKVRYASNTYERNKKLLATKSVSEDDVDNSLSTLEGLQAELLGAEAKLILAQDDLAYTRIESMLTGRVGRVNYTEGNYITQQSGPLCKVVQIDPIYVRFSMSEHDFATYYGNLEELKKRANISLQLANGEFYDGKGEISFIDNEIKTKTDSIYVWATYSNPDGILNPGGLCTVHLSSVEGEEFPSVKVSAVMFDADGHFVYVIEDGQFDTVNERGEVEGKHPGKTAVRRSVSIGPGDGVYQSIRSGLKEGEIVVVGGSNKIIPGGEIIPVEKNASTEEPAPVPPAADQPPAVVPDNDQAPAVNQASADAQTPAAGDAAAALPAPAPALTPMPQAQEGTLIPESPDNNQ
ncbi:MAG: efflux RND transporter periplasmic adaptor subunit [Thermoguttaceae bacterium]|nr:efflux RND transporter periplasmic adaptor subunit [Thermoguttaceae bacterium]